MQQHDFLQGTREWHAHRAACFNASDAPAMLGCSPYQSRTQLLHQLSTGLVPEHDAATEQRFADGHRFEALARPIAEGLIGFELYPVSGSEDFGLPRPLSASFDGITMLEDTVFEHKSLNDDIRAALADGKGAPFLPKHYRVQMEQQLMVSGAGRALFMASKWDGEKLVEALHCWYTPDQALRAEILAGWKQFAEDLANHQPAPIAAKVVAEPVQALPAVTVQVTGNIAVAENFKAFEIALRDFLDHRLIREPKTDQDFADLDVQIKALKGAEAALDSCEAQMLAQIATVDSAKKTKDMLAKLVRDNRLMAEKLLASEKERRRAEIVKGGADAFAAHVANLNLRLGRPYMPPVAADFTGVIRGKKSIASMEDAIATELARAKIAANEVADRIDLNLQHLRDHAGEFKHLFPDTAAIVLKAPEDLASLVTARIAEHRAAEERRLEAERERIRREEQERADREAREMLQHEQEAARKAQLPQAPAATPAPAMAVAHAAPAANEAATVVPLRAPATPPSLKLGEINRRLGVLSVTAGNLEALGFTGTKDRGAVLYHEADFDRICAALINHIEQVRQGELAVA